MRYRYKIILALKNPYDYAEYTTKSKLQQIQLIPLYDYAQKVGMLLMAMFIYPGLSPIEAYMAFNNDMNRDLQAKTAAAAINAGNRPKQQAKQQSCCGGSKRKTEGGKLR